MPICNDAELTNYFSDLAMGTPTAEMARKFIREYTALMSAPPEFAFIENTISNDGIQDFTGLGLFNGSTYAEFGFGLPNPMIVMSLRKINRIVLPGRQDFAFDRIVEGSRLTLQFFDGNTVRFFLSAAGKRNCEELVRVVQTYFLPIVI